MLILGVMVALTVFFETVSYINTIDTYETNEMKRLKSVVKTQSLHLESMHIEVEDLDSAQDQYKSIRSKLENALTNANRLNELEEGLSFILINTENGLIEIISSGRASGVENASPHVRSILEELPIAPVERGLENSNKEKVLFYAYPITFPGIKSYRGYLYLEEGIRENIANAKKLLYQRLIMAFLLICFLGFLGKKYLNKLLLRQSLVNEKLKNYADLADSRNKELEKLSFVLEKSENLILLSDKNGKIEWLNQKAKSANSFSAEELKNFVGRSLAEVSRNPRIMEVIETVRTTKEKYIYEAEPFNDIWTSTTVTPILDQEGKVENLLFVDADITKIKIAEIAISKLAKFAQESSSALMRFKKNGEILFANEPGRLLLQKWGAEVNGMMKKPSILNTIRLASDLEQDQQLNLESDQRIYNLRFHSVIGQDYVNVYADDITEVKLAEREYRLRASMVEKHNLNITDSINYAKRIQSAIIPGEEHIRKHFTDAFLIYKPKDIVSGDFVWLHELKPKQEYLFALVDCTGHGVPGAMLSIIGHSLLNEIVENEEITDPALILEELNKEVIKTLRQKTDGHSSDGMDVSIVKINLLESTIIFAGAYQDLYWMNGKLNTVKGNRLPIGGKHHDFSRKFQNKKFNFSKGDSIFLTSDGFVDQFGGPDNKKFMKKRLSNLISSNCQRSMQAQSFIFEKAFEEWKGSQEQIDDISLVGIKL